MNVLLIAIESAIENTVPIFVAISIAAYLAGPFMISAGISSPVRTAVYSVIGTCAGLWAYSSFDIPDRPFLLREHNLLSITYFAYSAAAVTVVMKIQEFRRKSKEVSDPEE